ncbi:MAG: hypothetical protein U1E33_03775 [Rhodospirillales bacterium]
MNSFRTVVRLMLSCFAILSLSSPVVAQDECREPNEPTCINSRYAFDDELSAVRCKRELDYYLREIGDFVTCLERRKQTSMQRSTQMLAKLNCRIRGELQC